MELEGNLAAAGGHATAIGRSASNKENGGSPVGLSRRVVLLMAIACGLNVANVYYAHPLLAAMARDFSVNPAAIGIVVTVCQIGYALGLVFIVPLGDFLDRRRLIIGQALASATMLLVVAAAPTFAVLLLGTAAVGLLAVVVQVLVAFSATLAAPAERGHVVGMVTSGVVIGILLARFASGVLADLGGWRSVYATSAVLIVVMAALLARALPRGAAAKTAISYPDLLLSLIHI